MWCSGAALRDWSPRPRLPMCSCPFAVNCQWLPGSSGSHPDLGKEASFLLEGASLYQPLSLSKQRQHQETKIQNRSRWFLIRRPPRKYPCSRTPSTRGLGLARCVVLTPSRRYTGSGVSVSKSDVKSGAAPAQWQQAVGSPSKPFVTCFAIPGNRLAVASVVPPRQQMATLGVGSLGIARDR